MPVPLEFWDYRRGTPIPDRGKSPDLWLRDPQYYIALPHDATSFTLRVDAEAPG